MNSADIKRLRMMIDLANKLDKKGLHKEADSLDVVINKFADDWNLGQVGEWLGNKKDQAEKWYEDRKEDATELYEGAKEGVRSLYDQARERTYGGDTSTPAAAAPAERPVGMQQVIEEEISVPSRGVITIPNVIEADDQTYIFFGDPQFAYRLSKGDTAYKAYNVSDGSYKGEYRDPAGLQLVKNEVTIKLGDPRYIFIPGDSVYAYKLNNDNTYDAFYSSTGEKAATKQRSNIEKVRDAAPAAPPPPAPPTTPVAPGEIRFSPPVATEVAGYRHRPLG